MWFGTEKGSRDPSRVSLSAPTTLTEMVNGWVPASGEISSFSVRVGEAWRVLGPQALAYHREELANDIESLRRPLAAADEPARGWRVGLIQRQHLKLLASTY
jgi:hypothetical protein